MGYNTVKANLGLPKIVHLTKQWTSEVCGFLVLNLVITANKNSLYKIFLNDITTEKWLPSSAFQKFYQ